MSDKLFRIPPLVFHAVERKYFEPGEFWEAYSRLGTFCVVYDWTDVSGTQKGWLWDHPTDDGGEASDYADGSFGTREEAVLAATAWYEREMTRGLEEVP